MKKLLVILFVMLLATFAFAQRLQIGSPASTLSTNSGPVVISSATSSAYTGSVTLLGAAEIKAMNGGVDFNGNINRIGWDRAASTGGYSGNDGILNIYLRTTTLPDLNDGTNQNWGTYNTGATLVYSSTTQNLNLTAGYQYFDLSTPFAYNTASNQNLLVIVQWQRVSSAVAATGWRYTTSGVNCFRYASSTTALLNTNAMTSSTSRPNIRIYDTSVNEGVQLYQMTANTVGTTSTVVNYRVRLINQGANPDAFDLSVGGNVYNTRILDAVGGNEIGATAPVNAGDSTYFFVEVTLGSAAMDVATITATSQANPSVSKDLKIASGLTRAYVNAQTSLQAGSPVTYNWIDPVANGHTELVGNYPWQFVGSHDDGSFHYVLQNNFHFGGSVIGAGQAIGIGMNGILHMQPQMTGIIAPHTSDGTAYYAAHVYNRDQGGTSAWPAATRIFGYYDAANQRTIITWVSNYPYNWSTTNGGYTYQAILYRNTNDIVTQYNAFPTTYPADGGATYRTGPRVGIISGATSNTTQLAVVPTGSTPASTTISATYGGGNLVAGVAIKMTQTYPNPSNYVLANNATSIDLAANLSWTAPGQTTFDINFGTDNPPPSLATGQVGTVYAPAGMTAGTTYYWQIVHHYAAQADYTSGVYSFTTVNPDAPNGPLTGSVANLGATSFDVGWIDNSTNEDYFNVYVAEGAFGGTFDPSTAPFAAQTATTTMAETGGAYTQSVTGLNPNTTYAVRVYSVNDNTVMKNGGKRNTGIIRSEWIETSEAVPVYETRITTGKDGKSISEQVPVAMKAAKGYWRNLTEENFGKTMSVDELFYSGTFASATNVTLAAVPDAPTLGAPTGSSIPVTVNNNGVNPNPATTVYAIRVNGTQYVQAAGTLGGTAVWRTLAQWGTPVNVLGLANLTTYTFDVAARNSNAVETAYSTSAQATTLNWTSNPDIYVPGTLPVAIVDVDTVDVPVVVENFGLITDLDLKFSGTHTYTGDMKFWLIHPNGTSVALMLQRGSGGDNFTNVVFDDEAAALISAGTAPFTGSWRPEGLLSSFDGLVASGTWILRCADVAGGDFGSITALQLAFATTPHVTTNPNGEGSQNSYTYEPPVDPLTGNLPPVEVYFPAQTGANGNPGTITVNVYYEVPGGNPVQLPTANTINRFWDIQTSTENFENATLRLRFTTADLPAGIVDPMTAVPALEVAYSNDGGLTWVRTGGAIVDLGGGVYEMVISGLNHFSLWSLGNGGILPVELSAFTASSADRQVVLNWRTESETNNDFFRVYRSVNATDRGELVGVVDGMGNNQTTHSYRYVDSRVQNGVTYYYRIADVDLNGIEALHPIVVNATPAAGARGVVPTEYSLDQNMPNPFNPTTEIRYAVKEAGLVTLKVFDISGREVATLVNGNYPANSYRVSFDATKLSAGVYFYQIRVNDFYAVRKMVVAK